MKQLIYLVGLLAVALVGGLMAHIGFVWLGLTGLLIAMPFCIALGFAYGLVAPYWIRK